MQGDIKTNTFLQEASKLVEEGNDLQKIHTALSKLGADEHTIKAILDQVKLRNILKRRKRGINLAISGSVVLITGFVLTVIFFHSGISIDYVMYGMTSIGVVLLLAGMIDVLGW